MTDEPLPIETYLPQLQPHLLAAPASAANPERVLVNFTRLVQNSRQAVELLASLAQSPRTAEILGFLFAGSQFLTEILLSHPQYVDLLADRISLAQAKSAALFRVQALQAAGAGGLPEQLDRLRGYQRRELLRIGACDLLDLYDLPVVTRQLSNLADGLVQACLALVCAELGTEEQSFAVLAMGKLGGQELNYSSDIDLVFLTASGSQNPAGRAERMGQKLIEALSKVTGQGFLYRVDMRLRPWGRVGSLVPTLDGYLGYLQQHARPWEKQALLKARAVAGDDALGQRFLEQACPLIFDDSPEALRAQFAGMKRQTEMHLQQHGRPWGEVKLGAGSIRDVEFITQFLQLAHGRRLPEVRSNNTLDALQRLFAQRLLSANQHRVLSYGYIFLRTIEHHLQMMHYQQTHQLPEEPQALSQLAQRLGFMGPRAGAHFLLRYEQYRDAIREIFLAYFGPEGPLFEEPAATGRDGDGRPHHILSMHPSYALAFDPDEIAAHVRLAGRLNADNLAEVQAEPLPDGHWRVTIVAYDYRGELSLICGLLFVYGLNILDGKVFTYEPRLADESARQAQTGRPKIVDVFSVQPLAGNLAPQVWDRYRADLAALLRQVRDGEGRAARASLAKRVALSLPANGSSGPASDFPGPASGLSGPASGLSGPASDLSGPASGLSGPASDLPGPASATLYPIDITIDNTASTHFTVLRIESLDTPGFLYELTNALAFYKIYIARMLVDSSGNRVQDDLYVCDADGKKITTPEKLRQLRAAVVLIKHFTHLLPHSPNPETALIHFREFIAELFARPDWPDELASLSRPEVLGALARLLGVSEFLWDDFLRMQYANLFPVVLQVDALASAKSQVELGQELDQRMVQAGGEWREALNTFKDRELFRVDMRNILGYTREFDQFSAELTELAETIIAGLQQGCFAELVVEYGEPQLEGGGPCGLAVCALGKCGGRELGFASDIELMFVYGGSGQTSGPKVISNAEFYEKLVQNFLGALSTRREGIFHIDLQLRPYGKAGSMAVSLPAFRRYYAPGGPAWAYERQALIKLRPVAGDSALGREITALRDETVYSGEPFDVTAMRAMRERQIRHFVPGGSFNAKFSPGGLLDLEYLVQALQITYGPAHPHLRLTNTRQALAALAESGFLPPEAYPRLRKAHTFLRWLIDSLRVVRGNAKDLTVPPAESDEFAYLARRLRYGDDIARLQDELLRYSAGVQEISRAVLDGLQGQT